MAPSLSYGSTKTRQAKTRQAGTDRLLRECRSLGTTQHRRPARARLESELGPELTRELITSLTERR